MNNDIINNNNGVMMENNIGVNTENNNIRANMENEMVKKRKRIIITCVVVFITTILAISLGFLIHELIYSARLSIMVAPSTAVVRVGDMTFSAFDNSVQLQPGEYDVEVFAEGFKTKTGHLSAKSGETAEINIYLNSNSPETADWYETHAGDALIVGEIQNKEALAEYNALMSREPGLLKLPLTVEFYSDDLSEYTKYVISFETDDSSAGFYLIVKDYTGVGLDVALSKIAEIGIDVSGTSGTDTGDVRVEYSNLSDDSMNAKAFD